MPMASPRAGATGRPAVAPAERAVPVATVGLCAAAFAALWLVDLLVLRTPVLTSFQQHPALTPLYAFWLPGARPQALAFLVVATVFTAVAGTLANPARVGRGPFVGALVAAAAALPLALFAVRQPVAELGTQFLIYPSEEFYADAVRIPALGPFLRNYVALMSQLSLHGQHFPPGHATLLYLVRQVFGPSMLAAGIAVLVCFAAAVVVAYLALREIAGEAAARQGALLLLACPSLLDFACTSMDAVFLLFATAAWWCGLRAAGPGARVGDALLAGAALLVATVFSFSAFPLGFALGLLVVVGGRASPAQVVRRLAGMGAGYAGAAVLLYGLTGFPLWTCVLAASEANLGLMTVVVGGNPFALYGRTSYGNAAAFVIGAGLALVPAVVARLRAAGVRGDAWAPVALVTLALMSAGGLYFMETERIWLFAMPWLAAVAVAAGPLAGGTLRVLLVAGLAQALAMEVALFTLW